MATTETTTTIGINSSINLVDLDFQKFKNSLKTYLRSQPLFRDYDFEGSNMNVLLDLLSYNTYVNAFYLNMIGNEMFIDTAQLRESIISRAKELNYVPRSFRSARAEVIISIETDGTVPSITIPKGTSFSTRIGSNNYTFVTDQPYVVSGANNVFVSNNIFIYEGQYVVDTFNVNYSNTAQRYVLSNPTIDVDSLTVTVLEDSGANVLPYLKATSLFDQQSNSQIFFIQGAENDQYEIKFGDGVIGRRPKDNAIILCEYRVTKGELPNGAYVFTSDGPIGGFSNVTVTTVQAAAGGAVSESDESIKDNAPRYFTSQERAITADDYKNLLMLNFPEINTMAAFGGEEVFPPQYGKVFLAIDLKDVDGIPDIKKEQYYNFIKPRCSLSIDPVFIDPEFMYINIDTVVRYNVNKTPASTDSIKTLVLNKIDQFNQTNLDDFDSILRYSSLVSQIDSADPSILGNQTIIKAMREIIPILGEFSDYEINFYQSLAVGVHGIQHTHSSRNNLTTISSSVFISNGKTVSIEDDGMGSLMLKDFDGTTIRSVGSVDYEIGRVFISQLIVDSFMGTGLKIYAQTKTGDISSSLRILLTIRRADVNIAVVAERE